VLHSAETGVTLSSDQQLISNPENWQDCWGWNIF